MRNTDPKLKPQKGWRYRVILCDDQGNVVSDDFNQPEHAGVAAKKLVPALMEKRKHGEAVPEETE